MDYVKADEVFPEELFEELQKYAEGKLIYIPKKKESRVRWGTKNKTRKKIDSETAIFIMTTKVVIV